MALIASDGYEYEDLTQRLLGNRLGSSRNDMLTALRDSRYEEAEVKAFYEAYDRATDCPTRNHAIGNAAGWHAINVKRRTRDAGS